MRLDLGRKAIKTMARADTNANIKSCNSNKSPQQENVQFNMLENSAFNKGSAGEDEG